MSNRLKIVFMGTPDFAVAPLKTLIEANYNVVGVITAPDRPAGRGRKVQQSAVKQYTLQHNITILQPTNLKDEYFLTALKSLEANLFVVVAFRMLPKVVWQMPKFGTFNLHASLLPNYRGAAPINWAIINGEKTTGVTTFFIDEKIDTGAIILQEETAIDRTDNAGSLHDKLMVQGAQLVLQTVQQIESGKVTTQPQDESMAQNPAPKIHKETSKINWDDSLTNIHNFIRGLSPYPAAWCFLDNNDDEVLNIKVYKSEPEFVVPPQKPKTVIVENNTIKVAHKEGYLHLQMLQLPGKKGMDAKALLNGFQFNTNAKVR
jgi:methionyl-tRNA formyltransferase